MNIVCFLFETNSKVGKKSDLVECYLVRLEMAQKIGYHSLAHNFVTICNGETWNLCKEIYHFPNWPGKMLNKAIFLL